MYIQLEFPFVNQFYIKTQTFSYRYEYGVTIVTVK
jgi:hypothetical protein